jgi:hypothetical protein
MTIRRFILTEANKKYEVVSNHFTDDQELFETFGEELDYILSVDPKYVWSWQKKDGEEWAVRAGYLDVDVEGYYITETAWESKDEFGTQYSEGE